LRDPPFCFVDVIGGSRKASTHPTRNSDESPNGGEEQR
jgi:hypothetical protein